MSDFNDFGFTTCTAEELEVVQQANTALEVTDTKVKRIREAIQPLLDNLRNNPEKDYIYWPNRTEKIDSFEQHLDSILTD